MTEASSELGTVRLSNTAKIGFYSMSSNSRPESLISTLIQIPILFTAESC